MEVDSDDPNRNQMFRLYYFRQIVCLIEHLIGDYGQITGNSDKLPISNGDLLGLYTYKMFTEWNNSKEYVLSFQSEDWKNWLSQSEARRDLEAFA